MKRAGKVLGVLNVYSGEQGAFEEEETRLLQELADDLAFGLESLEAQAALRRRLRELEALTQIGADLTAGLQIEPLLENILTAARRAVPAAEKGSLLLLNEAGDPEIRALSGYREHAIKEERFPSEGGYAARALHEGRPLLIPDARADEAIRYDGDIQEMQAVLSAAAAPLALHGRIIGVITLDNASRREAFTEDDLRILSAFADQAAVAIDSSRLLVELKRRADALQTIYEANRALAGTLDLGTILETVAESARQLTRARYAALGQFDSAGRLTRFITLGLTPQERARLGDSHPKGKGLLGAIHQDRHPIRLQDIASDPRSVGFPPGHPHMRTFLGVPILSRGEVVGNLYLAEKEAGSAFTPEDELVVGALAADAAIVIENARLFEKVSRHAAELEQRVAERTAALHAEKERLETLLQSVGDGIVITGPRGHIREVNPVFVELTGISAEELTDRFSDILMMEPRNQSDVQEMTAAAQSGQRWQGTMILRRQDGSSTDVAVTLAPVRDDDGEIVAFINTVRDISHLKELDRLKSKFVSDVSHELRTPLTNFRLYLDLLESGQPAKRAEYVETLRAETDRLTRLVEEVLDISRLDLEPVVVIRERVNMLLVAEPVVINYQAQAEAHGQTLTLLSDKGTPDVLGDPNQLVQVVTNLVSNALNYTPEGGKVVVRLFHEGEEVGLSVQDNGRGISVEDREHLFERFYRGRAALQTGAPGSGLGVAICKEIVDRHGGRIEVDSETGVGTTMTVWLPAAKAPDAE
jgi:PAS domain S-box-containing protein